jgi:hypothetical protein
MQFGEIRKFQRNISSPSSGSKSKPSKKPTGAGGMLRLPNVSVCFLLSLLFDTEDRSDMFLQNVGSLIGLNGVISQKMEVLQLKI